MNKQLRNDALRRSARNTRRPFGTQERRPELDRLIAEAHRRRFDAVVVWRFDRFARSVSHLLRARNIPRPGRGVRQPVRAGGHFHADREDGIHVFGAVAELERSLIVELERAGLRNARAKGKRLGLPRVSMDCAKIAVLRAAGLSSARIAAELGLGARVRCGAALRSPPKTPAKSLP